MNANDNIKDKYNKSNSARQKHIDSILNCQSKKKIVVAGPGTGKTYLFKEILKNKNKSLTLTFINTLVEDLSLELFKLSEVRTLHGFAKSVLGTAKAEVRVFPKLSQVIKEDAKILLSEDIDFDYIFHNLEDKNGYIDFYKKRKNYYDDHYGYSDIIYALVKYLENRKDKIPSYDQIVVDEFQDFNKLEVSLIELLSEKSPILLAGDDDQALYDFKSASASHIRQRYCDANQEYTSFSLPYCSRCTRIIVDAVNDIIKNAIENGNLSNRINKHYQYFEDENKDQESAQHSKVIYAQVFAKQIPWVIGKQIEAIAEQERKNFHVLIISPTKVQSRSIVESLKDKGFENIESSDRKDEKDVSMLDGLKLLLNDNESNLGWRIVSKYLLDESNFKNLLKQTNKDNAEKIVNLIDKDTIRKVKEMLRILKSLNDDKKKIDKEKFNNFLQQIETDPYEIARSILKEDIASVVRMSNPGIRKIPIKATTIQSSKGLAAEYVFITHFDNQYFIKDKDKNKISDRDICNFLVSLTRARKKVFLISSNKSEPTFLKWIDSSRLEKLL